ncbi:MAG: ATP-grasp domain-containing protein [Candidatus Limnocylindria bacterium]
MSRSYRTADFLAAARQVGVGVVIGTDRTPALSGLMPEPPLRLDFTRPADAVDRIVADATRRRYDGIVAVDDAGTRIAAAAAERLKLPHNPPAAVATSHDKAASRAALHAAGLPTPCFAVHSADRAPATLAESIRYPCVIKPLDLSASRGVIRADDPITFAAAWERVTAIVRAACADPRVLVEDFVPGEEVAVEALLHGGVLEPLAIFDKPDPLDGPYFEETYYITPSRRSAADQGAVCDAVQRAVWALGLREGPIHAEVRLNELGPWVGEVAARSIGGLCARALRFGAGITLEELIIRHAAQLPIPPHQREDAASGVLMLPIPSAGTLRGVHGRAAARAVPGIAGLEISVPAGQRIVPLPEGDRYLGFLFARGATAGVVERSLRAAHAQLRIEIEPDQAAV